MLKLTPEMQSGHLQKSFITLHKIEGERIRINISHITSYAIKILAHNNAATGIQTPSDFYLVKESPADIDAMISVVGAILSSRGDE